MDEGTPLDVREHPARKLAVLLVVVVTGLLTVFFLRPSDQNVEERLGLYIGSSLRLLIRTDPGAAPDDLERLEPVVLEAIETVEGVPTARLRLEGMTSVGAPEEPAILELPLDRIVQAAVGPRRIRQVNIRTDDAPRNSGRC